MVTVKVVKVQTNMIGHALCLGMLGSETAHMHKVCSIWEHGHQSTVLLLPVLLGKTTSVSSVCHVEATTGGYISAIASS